MTALHVLPREVLARCLEFLPFDQALEAKQVSKVVRSAARRALTGRWRSIMFVEEQGLDLIENSTPSEWSEPRGVEVRRALATFRAAWELGRQLRLLVDDDMDEELIEQGLYIKDSEETGFWGRKLFGSGLGEWADPELAAYFVFHLVERLPEPTGFEFVDFDDYWHWSANWWDRYKSSDFLRTAQEIIARESRWP